MKKLALKKDVLNDLRSDELAQVAGGTLSVRVCVRTRENTDCICYQSLDECLSVRVCVRTIQDSVCICL